METVYGLCQKQMELYTSPHVVLSTEMYHKISLAPVRSTDLSIHRVHVVRLRPQCIALCMQYIIGL